MRRGLTLLEIAVVIAIIALITAIATPALLRRLDRTKVRHATADIIMALGVARSTAVAREAPVAVTFDSLRSAVTVTVAGDTILDRMLGAVYGVDLRSNRDSLAYGPTGLGHGAANQSVVVARGAARDTVVISRLGRVRY
jgi:prepilin-type N-terminal cleavage/methylation domain-containing protein